MDAQTTVRGFQVGRFVDVYGTPCSVQVSSVILGDDAEHWENPGTSALWIGVDDAKPKVMAKDAHLHSIPLDPGKEVIGWVDYPIPDDVLLTTRMHVNRAQVKVLIEMLQRWLDTGKLFETAPPTIAEKLEETAKGGKADG